MRDWIKAFLGAAVILSAYAAYAVSVPVPKDQKALERIIIEDQRRQRLNAAKSCPTKAQDLDVFLAKVEESHG